MLRQTFKRLLARGQRARQRRALQDLPDFILKDIGLGREDLKRNRGPYGW
jgi:uncharacterized protein YjiS (DUF1127 family)